MTKREGVPVTFVVTPDVAARMDAVAGYLGRSRSSLMRLAFVHTDAVITLGVTETEPNPSPEVLAARDAARETLAEVLERLVPPRLPMAA